jgi:hypothetical protein
VILSGWTRSVCRTGLQHLRLFRHDVQPRGFDLQQVWFTEISETFTEGRPSAEVGVAKDARVINIRLHCLFDQISGDVVLGLVLDLVRNAGVLLQLIVTWQLSTPPDALHHCSPTL